MHSPYAFKKRARNDVSSLCVFHVGKCNVGLCLCAVVCMALTVQEHTVNTPACSVLFSLVTPAESMDY